MASQLEQLQAMRQLNENWDGYGAAVPRDDVIEVAAEFVNLMEALLRKRSAMPPVIHVSPTRTGGILIEWEDAEMQHEVEINPDRSFGFLHLHKASGRIETRKLFPGADAVVQPGFLQELCQLLAA
jgi:hypothetical protein